MLHTLEIQNFKAFGDRVQLELRPLTILIGANGAGKGSALEAIGLLSQSVPGPDRPPQMKWRDALIDLGATGAAAFHHPDNDHQLALAVEVEAGEHFRNWLRRQYDEPDVHVERLGYRLQYRRGTAEWKHELVVNGDVVATNATIALGRGLIKKDAGAMLECDFSGDSERVFEPVISGNAVLSPKLFLSAKAVGGQAVDHPTHRALMTFGLFTSYIGAYLKHRVFMLGADRVPRREEPRSEGGPLIVGRQAEHTLKVLSLIFAHPKYSAQARKIQHWAEVFGLSSLASGWVREELLHAGYLDSTFQTPLGIESAGFGARQILPVIAQIFAAPKNSVVLIEEPEMSLHPESQTDLARMFADALSYGQQLLVTTHSQPLLLAMMDAVRGEQLRAEDVVIHQVSKSPSGAKVDKVRIEDDGAVRPRGGEVVAFSESVLKRGMTG